MMRFDMFDCSREAEERIVALQKEIEQMKAEEQRKVEQERDECVRQLRQKFPEKYEEEKARILAEEQPKLESLTKQMKEEVRLLVSLSR